MRSVEPYFGQNASNIDKSDFVLRYNEKMSWIGTSGVGPFMDDSKSFFDELCRSATNNGTVTSTTKETRSTRLEPEREESMARYERGSRDTIHTQQAARGNVYQVVSQPFQAHRSVREGVERD